MRQGIGEVAVSVESLHTLLKPGTGSILIGRMSSEAIRRNGIGSDLNPHRLCKTPSPGEMAANRTSGKQGSPGWSRIQPGHEIRHRCLTSGKCRATEHVCWVSRSLLSGWSRGAGSRLEVRSLPCSRKRNISQRTRDRRTVVRRTPKQAAKLVKVHFSWCGHEAMLPQGSSPSQCPQGCNANGGWDPLIARRRSMLGRRI